MSRPPDPSHNRLLINVVLLLAIAGFLAAMQVGSHRLFAEISALLARYTQV